MQTNTERLIRDLKIAYNERGVLTLLEYAEKGQDYYLDEGLTIPLLIAEGDINRKHFRRYPNIDIQTIRDYFGSSESIEHLNAKRQILYSKSITIGKLTTIKGHTAKEEVIFSETGNIIDVVLYDKEGNVLLGIEIYHTNKKSKEAIKKLNQLNINIYEQDINDDSRSKFICTATEGDSFEKEIRGYEEQLRELQEADRKNRERLKASREPISRIRKDIKAEVIRIAEGYEQIEDVEIEIEYQERGIYSEQGKRLAWDIEDIEAEIRKAERTIEEEEARIRKLKNIPSASTELTELIGNRRSENSRTESEQANRNKL